MIGFLDTTEDSVGSRDQNVSLFWKVVIESSLQARVGRWVVMARASGNISRSVQIQNVQVCVCDSMMCHCITKIHKAMTLLFESHVIFKPCFLSPSDSVFF